MVILQLVSQGLTCCGTVKVFLKMPHECCDVIENFLEGLTNCGAEVFFVSDLMGYS